MGNFYRRNTKVLPNRTYKLIDNSISKTELIQLLGKAEDLLSGIRPRYSVGDNIYVVIYNGTSFVPVLVKIKKMYVGQSAISYYFNFAGNHYRRSEEYVYEDFEAAKAAITNYTDEHKEMFLWE